MAKKAKRRAARTEPRKAAKKPGKQPRKAATKTARVEAPMALARDAYELPVLDGADAIALAKELVTRRLTKPAAIAAEARRMASALEAAKRGGKDAKALDAAMDRAWATFVRRIQDHAELPLDRYPDAALARQVYAIVRDLTILDLGYLAEFAQIGARLDSLRREGLLEAAEGFAGNRFLHEVLHWHERYGEALGVGGESSGAAKKAEARHALVSAIEGYVVQALALARTEGAAVAKALAPIIAFREQKHARLVERPERKPPAHPPIG